MRRSRDTLGCGREVFETFVIWTLSWKEQSLKARMPNMTNTKRLAHQLGSYPPGSARTKPEMLELVNLVVCAQREDIQARTVPYSRTSLMVGSNRLCLTPRPSLLGHPCSTVADLSIWCTRDGRRWQTVIYANKRKGHRQQSFRQSNEKSYPIIKEQPAFEAQKRFRFQKPNQKQKLIWALYNQCIPQTRN